MRKYWTGENWKNLHESINYVQLSEIGLDVLRRMPQPVGQVCGPITTGGAGSLEENARMLQAYIDKLALNGLNIFDQMPFQDPMLKIIRSKPDDAYDHDLLEKFCLRLFESGFINTLYFIQRWETSIGARWEHKQARELGMNREYPPDLHLL